MTEQQWLQSPDPEPMLAYLQGEASHRKLRLFAVACCRQVWHLLVDERSRCAAEAAERYADGLTTRRELVVSQGPARAAVRAVRAAGGGAKEAARAAVRAAAVSARGAASGAARGAVNAAWSIAAAARPPLPEPVDFDALAEARGAWGRSVHAAAAAERAAQTSLLRDLIGPLPFRPVALGPAWLAWRDGLLVSMARKMYESRDFADMPVLADALEEAGCTNPEVLSHCREQGAAHVRGCWVVDRLLGRE